MSQNHKVFTCLYKHTHTHTNETYFFARAHQVGPFMLQNNRLCMGLFVVEIPVLVQNHLQCMTPAASLFFCPHNHSAYFKNAVTWHLVVHVTVSHISQ